jgi:ABC-type ATPase involved in cell division
VTSLSISALSKDFEAGVSGCAARVSVLRDIDFALWPGEIVALAGARGSGRSTLLRCAAGVLRPDSGSISWFGAGVEPWKSVAYVSASAAGSSRARAREPDAGGLLYAALEVSCAERTRVLLVDDLDLVGALERRLALALLRRHSLAGASILFAANEELANASVVSRVVTLADGALVQRRKRSAARIAASSCASRARASARSTYGRSLRSPQ